MPSGSDSVLGLTPGVKALVTGGAGFIGSHIVEALVAQGAHVRVLDDFTTGRASNLDHLTGQIEVVRGDIRNEDACAAAAAGVELVFHLAAFISVPGSVADPVTADSINIDGTRNVLRAARAAGARRLVMSSSSAVYGNTLRLPTPEDELPAPTSPYGLEKLYGEHLCRLFWELYAFEAVALRYFNVYGPRQRPDSQYAAAIPKFIDRALKGEPPTIFGDGLQTRDFLFVQDVARANLLAAAAPGAAGKLFNIAGGSSITVTDLAAAVVEAAGSSVAAVHADERAGDIKHSAADTTRAREVLGFAPQWTLERGLLRTVEALRG
ncbi:MAG: SDR family NAD(P)-dependent oxidoreductase [Armatimonadetes bacterium]|nr:SDR family NAD(P)-dependent oxidoreductase [Armatimonadota bacterium]